MKKDELTPKERISMTLKGEEPDRVPVGFQANAWGWAKLYGPKSFKDFGWDGKKIARVWEYVIQNFTIDGITMFLDSGVAAEAILNEMNEKFYYVDMAPPQPPGKIYSGNEPIKSLEDAEKKLKLPDPERSGRFPHILEATEILHSKYKDRYSIGGFLGSWWHGVGEVLGFYNFSRSLVLNPDLVKKVEEIVNQTNYEFAKAQIERGASGFTFVTAVGYSTPDEYKKFNFGEREMLVPKKLKEEFGVGITAHACGFPNPAFDIMKKFKFIDVWFMSETVDLLECKKLFPDQTMMGNVHPIDTLLLGSPKKVEKECKDLIYKVGPGGRFILYPGCSMNAGTPEENVLSFTESVRKYGWYPITEK